MSHTQSAKYPYICRIPARDWEILEGSKTHPSIPQENNPLGHSIWLRKWLIVRLQNSVYAGDLESRRSTSGVVFTLHNGPVSWLSRRQSCGAFNNKEEKFIRAAEAAKDGVWLKRLYSEIVAADTSTPLRFEKRGDIALIHDPVFHTRTRQVELCISYLETEYQLEDIFTKALVVPRFNKRCGEG